MSKLKRFSGFAYLLPAIPTILIGALFWLRILTLDGDGGAYYVLKWSTIYWTIAALAMFLVSALAMRLKQKGIIFVICGSFWLGLSIWVSQTAGFRRFVSPL
ncbi:MAG: hypothetical protein GY726_17895 [Proteobacteria bacterium]|nr:hypothetical protein [Pseudomonadota bacterium]